MACVHQVTVTLPHSVSSAGWWPSRSASAPTRFVKASASTKFGNSNTRSSRATPSRCTTAQPGTSRASALSSAPVTCGESGRQAVQRSRASPLISRTRVQVAHRGRERRTALAPGAQAAHDVVAGVDLVVAEPDAAVGLHALEHGGVAEPAARRPALVGQVLRGCVVELGGARRERRERQDEECQSEARRGHARSVSHCYTPGHNVRPGGMDSMVRMTGGAALVRSLYGEGVRVVFGLPGVQLYGVIAALLEEPRIRFIVTRHEQATSYMADGYARAGGGDFGTALVVPGPGLLNASAGLSTAYAA